MRPVNLQVLAQGFQTLRQGLFPAFEAQLSDRDEPLATIKPHEAESVVRLVAALSDGGATMPHCFEGFVFSFTIPQISSEFDLLKITETTVVNVELKSEDVGTHRIAEQLARTRHYLSPLGRTIRTFTFVVDSGSLFERDESGDVFPVGIPRLVEVLASAGTAYTGQVEDLFRASNYLVSPLNDTGNFLAGKYFLTNHQAQIKASFVLACAESGGLRPRLRPAPDAGRDDSPPAFLVYGSAGTGKTLLLYDLARTLGTGTPACVIHCGVLSAGHERLNQAQDAFRIVEARHSNRIEYERYDTLLVDEAQRMWPSQLERVVHAAASAHLPLYLSLDRRQVLSHPDDAHDLESVVRSAFPHARTWELSRKIRTNRELVGFIRTLLDLPGGERLYGTRHVKVGFARDASGARVLVDAFRDMGYQYISLAHASHDDPELDELDVAGCPNPHMVIGQEFDKVVMAIGPHVCIDNNQLHRRLVYQGLTRARTDIALVVYGNATLAERLLEAFVKRGQAPSARAGDDKGGALVGPAPRTQGAGHPPQRDRAPACR